MKLKTKRQLRGLEKVCKLYGRIKSGPVMMVWDYARELAVNEKEMPAGSMRWQASERARHEAYKRWAAKTARFGSRLVLLAFLTGCAGIKDEPPKLPTARQSMSFAVAAVVPSPTTNAVLSWDLPANTNGITFIVEQMTWSHYATLRSNTVIVPLSADLGFFRVAARSATNVMLNWVASPDSTVDGYRLYQSSATVMNDYDCGNVLTFTVPVIAGEKYTFYVTAYNVDGIESVPSNVIEYEPGVAFPPAGLRISVP